MHDMAYARFGSGEERQSADAILATKARMRSHSGDATIGEQVSATVVAYGMLFKWMIGLKSMEMQQPRKTEEKNDLHKVRQ